MLSVGAGLGNFTMRVDLGNHIYVLGNHDIDCECIYLLMECLYVQ